MSHLQIVVFRDEPHKVVKQVSALQLRQAIDMLYMMPNGEDAFPAGDRIGPHDRVLSGEDRSDILRGAYLKSDRQREEATYLLGPHEPQSHYL